MIKSTSQFILLFALCIFLISWGTVGHKTINGKTPDCFPGTMKGFSVWSDSLALHASDADTRKNTDSNESPKHFIDIDNYAEFLSTGRIASTYDSIIKIHGSTFVVKNGTVPWATKNTFDSLVVDFKKLNWHKAMLDASDLGHYVGDGHMPLHLSANYDGQLSGQSGVHSRYESTMVGAYVNSLNTYSGSSVSFITDVQQYIFSYIYKNQKYRDSVLLADTYAAKIDASYGSAYTAALWSKTQFTITLFKNASHSLAELIYTAWVTAGSPPFGAKNIQSAVLHTLADNFRIYPNPTSGMLTVTGDNISKIQLCALNGATIGYFIDKQIDISNLPLGMYLVNIYGKDNSIRREKVLLTK